MLDHVNIRVANYDPACRDSSWLRAAAPAA